MNNAIEKITNDGQTTLRVVFHNCEGGGFTAECLDIPGCVSEGDTMEEAEANIKDAMNACISVLFEDCINQVRPKDFGTWNLTNISKQEKFAVPTPRVTAYA